MSVARGRLHSLKEAIVMADQPNRHEDGETQPMGRDELDSPSMRARIEVAKQRAARGRVGDEGSTAEDLQELASEQRRLASSSLTPNARSSSPGSTARPT
jgi:hypothetical protein